MPEERMLSCMVLIRGYHFMRKKGLLFAGSFLILFSTCFAGCKVYSEVVLKKALNKKFLIGVAMNTPQIIGQDLLSDKLIVKHFNSVVAENCMKSEIIQPIEGEFDFFLADQFVSFGEKHRMVIIGHTLIWHSQAPKWFFVDDKGNQVSREVLIERMKKHITTVVNRYKGRVRGWDVVNEAINDDGSWRESPFYKIIGKEYVKLAFQFAHEADPKAELYYNDFSMAKEGRRTGVVKMIKELQAEGVHVAAIGMQGHFTMDYPSLDEEEKSIVTFSELGTKVMITELDLTIIHFPTKVVGADVGMKFAYDPVLNPYPKGMPDSVATKWNKRLGDFFKLFIKHSDVISRVTVWGLTDNQTWRNDWPIKGRSDYPLLFDRNFNPKPIVEAIIKEATK